MLVLGIETSCDETSAAIVRNGCHVLSNSIQTQIDLHQVFGGVVPEVASRHHLEMLPSVIQKALDQANVSFQDLSAIAVTNRPGLIGALLVGLTSAKAMAYALDIPLIPVNHLHAHLCSIFIESSGHSTPPSKKVPNFPFLGLLISGGHSIIYKVHSFSRFELLCQTRDDAIGEALDKAGKMLGLPYPGGPEIDRLSKNSKGGRFSFPRPLAKKTIREFSFSGLKTSLLNKIQEAKRSGNPLENPQFITDIAHDFQEATLDHLLEKTRLTIQKTNLNQLVVAGGVAANSRLRTKLQELAKDLKIEVWIPKPIFCTDNGAMIAALGSHLLAQTNPPIKNFDPKHLTLNAFSSNERE